MHPAFPLALMPRQGIAVATRAGKQGKEAEDRVQGVQGVHCAGGARGRVHEGVQGAV